jgi:hypothetical protein
MVATTVSPAVKRAATSVESASPGVHASASSSVTSAMLSKCGRRNQDEECGSEENGFQQGGLVHG